jgi:hypothetical protein
MNYCIINNDINHGVKVKHDCYWKGTSLSFYVATLTLGLRPRQELARVRAKKETQESHLMLSGVQENVREQTLTLPSELPLWELKSWWTFKFSESNCRGQNPLDWGVLYIIEKLLERRYLKWARMTHLDILNISYGQKKGRESNWQFDSGPLKVRNRPNLLAFRWHATYNWKALDEGYNFDLDLISIQGLHTKLWAPKVTRVSYVGILGLWLGSPGTKWHLGASPIVSTKYTIRGKVVASPKSGPWWILWVHVCPWLIHAPKCSSYALTILWFGLCRFV